VRSIFHTPEKNSAQQPRLMRAAMVPMVIVVALKALGPFYPGRTTADAQVSLPRP